MKNERAGLESSIYLKYHRCQIGYVVLSAIVVVLVITNICTQQLLKKSCEAEVQLKKEKVYVEELYKSLKDDYLDLQEQLHAQ